MVNYQQVEIALIRYLMSYPGFALLPQEEQWKISIDKRRELIELVKEDKTILNISQELYV